MPILRRVHREWRVDSVWQLQEMRAGLVMAIDYDGFLFGKGTPHVTEKIKKARALAKEEADCRAAVDKRDGRKCFFPGCKRTAGEKHHIVSRSVRGKTEWRTDGILSSCTEHHRYFKAGLIRVEGNPDKGRVKVFLTKLGEEAKISIPKRAA